MAIAIRAARPADVARIAAIVDRAYEIYIARIGKKLGPMLDDYAARVAEDAVWVAEQDGTVQGILVLLPEPDHILLDNIAVAPEAHGQGVGRALVAFAEDEARRRGFAEIRLYTHEKMTENIAMYPRLGYAETHRAQQAGYDRVFFRKKL